MKVSLYNDASEKKIDVVKQSLSPTDCLIQCLDVLDLNRALSQSRKYLIKKNGDEIKWIELSFRRK